MNIFSRRIYADWAATTPLHRKVASAMRATYSRWYNPSALYREAVVTKKTLEDNRVRTARVIGVKPEEVYFTSGGTESNTTVIQGVIRAKLEGGTEPKQVHVVTTTIEHSSVLQTLKLFESQGVQVTYVNPQSDGVVSAESILSAITPQTALVTCMYVNNEIGTIQPVSKIGAGIRKIRAQKQESDIQFPVFHVDASQAPLWLSCEIEGLRADVMTLDAHKMQGPKGIGALIMRRHVPCKPLMVGGGQERGMRPTTESTILIAGFTRALELAQEGREARERSSRARLAYFSKELSRHIPTALINGSLEKRIPHNINISLPEIDDPEFTVLQLDALGIACSTKSSCLVGESESYVVKALGGPDFRASKTLRFTFAPTISRRSIDRIIRSLKTIVG